MATAPAITSVWPPDWTSAGSQTPNYPRSVTDTSLGIILPLAALSLFMVFIVAGLLWNAWNAHRSAALAVGEWFMRSDCECWDIESNGILTLLIFDLNLTDTLTF